MSFFSRLFSKPKAPTQTRQTQPIRHAGYDAAKTTDSNRDYWAEAEDLSAVAELTPETRRKLRLRARYEVKNNSYAAGLVRTLVSDTVGTGPRLQMLTDDDVLNEAIENEWRIWSMATNFAQNIRVMVGVQIIAGECFAVFRDSKQLQRLGMPVTLDIRLIEPDQVTDPNMDFFFRTNGDDGIVCDEDGDVVAYKILKAPPNDNRFFQQSWEADTVKAENVLHYLQTERPGQLRGSTPLAPSLPIFAQLRRFTSATLTAAEVAAMLAGVMTLPGNPLDTSTTPPSYDSMDTVALVKGMLLTLPEGAAATQFKPEQPTTNYEMFVNAKLRECGRCLDVPFCKMAGDYSASNYSSGRLDDQIYWTRRGIDRQMVETLLLNRTFYKFVDFLRFVLPAVAIYKDRPWDLKHTWHYDGRQAIDPFKDAKADEINLTTGVDGFGGIIGRNGEDWQQQLRHRKRVLDEHTKLGLPIPAWLSGSPVAPTSPADQQLLDQPAKAVAA